MTGSLFAPVDPPVPPGIDLRLGDVGDLLREQVGAGARLVMADPPWTYDNAGVRGNADDHYDLLDAYDGVLRLCDCGGV
jgi:hypothetical protein